jgi:trehalose/maltose hydrolase-like predicted phosphorylase
MAGTLDLVQRSYMGIHVRDDVLHFGPMLPAEIKELSFSMQFRRTPIRVTLTDGRLTLAAHPEAVNRPIKVAVRDEVRELAAGDRSTFEFQPVLRGKQPAHT